MARKPPSGTPPGPLHEAAVLYGESHGVVADPGSADATLMELQRLSERVDAGIEQAKKAMDGLMASLSCR